MSLPLFCSAYIEESLNFFPVSPLITGATFIYEAGNWEALGPCISSETVLVTSWLEQVCRLSFHPIPSHGSMV